MQSSDLAFSPAIRVSRVLGARVVDEKGGRLGTIHDVVLDKSSNTILYAVVIRSGFVGLSQAFLSLQWSSLQYDVFDRSYKVEGLAADWASRWKSSVEELP